MNRLATNLIQGASGGIVAGAFLGLVEAIYHLSNAAPDLLSPFYAVVLYGLLGLPMGLGAALVAAAVDKWVRELTEGQAWAFGACGAVTPMGVFILRYLANKVVYAEQGVPLVATLGLIALVGVFDLILLFGVSRLIDGPAKPMLKATGLAATWGGLAVITGIIALVPYGSNPRDNFASGKGVGNLADKPNILIIMVDTLRADHLGAYGSDLKTPQFDSLAKDGIVFEQAIAGASWTRSAGASIMTSRIPSGHNAALKASRLPGEVVMYSEVLQDGGYTTGALINNINLTSTFGFDQGFDTFMYESPEYPFMASEGVFALTMYKVVHKLNEKILGKFMGKSVEGFYQPAEVVLSDAQGFIQANKDGRWALFVHLMEPHDPYFEHPYIDGSGGAEFNGKGYARAEHEHPDPSDENVAYLKRVYRDEVVHMDNKMAPFLQWLRDQGHYDNTVIVVTADHGEEFFEHGGFWHGTTLYDEQVHVPLIVKMPKNRMAGFRAPWQVRTIDIAPTLAKIAGLEKGEGWQGDELISDVRRATRGDFERPNGCDRYRQPNSRPAVSEENFEGNVISSLRKGGFKYIQANAGNPRGLPEVELFDIVHDPGETEDISASTSSICGAYPDGMLSSYKEEAEGVIKLAAAGATSGGTATMSAADCEKMVALGYMSADEKCGSN